MRFARIRPTGFWPTAIQANKRMKIGIIGAGQLGQMLGHAARDLGVECVFLDPAEAPPAAGCGDVRRAPFDDVEALRALATECDVITYEFENVPVAAIRSIAEHVSIFPPPDALHYAQDRLFEKQLLQEIDIPLAGYQVINSREDLDQAATALGLPMVVKTRRFGYDGKGQFVIKRPLDIEKAWATLGEQALIAEQWINYRFEISCIGARNVDGDIAIYPIAQNEHRDGILRTSVSPLDDAGLQTQAAAYVGALLRRLDYVGVIALELFVAGRDLLANEFAPRVHNSGHWSIEGSVTSQFENHLRAIMNRSLGSTDSVAHAGMVNLIGNIPELARALPDAHLHDYGKEPRPGRKLGHITVLSNNAAARDERVGEIDKSVTQRT